MNIIFTIFITLLLMGCEKPKTSLGYELKITQNSFGSIYTTTKLDKISLIGVDIERLVPIDSSKNEILLKLTKNNNQIAHIVYDTKKDQISHIYILSKEIVTSFGEHIGDIISKDAHCKIDLCYYSKEPSIFYKIEPKTKKILEIYYKDI